MDFPENIRQFMMEKFRYDPSEGIAEVITVFLLLWALMPFNPYGYYIFLKLVVSCTLIYLAIHAYKNNNKVWLVLCIGYVLIYNPIIRVHFSREIWSIINIITALGIARFSWLLQQK